MADVDIRALLVAICGLACAVVLAAVLGGCTVPVDEVGSVLREHSGHCELEYIEVTVPEGSTLLANESTGVTSVDVDSGCFARYNSTSCGRGGETVRLWSKGDGWLGYEVVEGGVCP